MFIPRRRHGLQITIWTAIAVVALAAGFAIAQFRTALVDAPILRQPRTSGGIYVSVIGQKGPSPFRSLPFIWIHIA